MNIARTLGLILDIPATDLTKATSSQSIQALMYGLETEPPGVLMNPSPVDMRHPTAVKTLHSNVNGRIHIPDDEGQYYFAFVGTGVHQAWPVLIREGEVVDFVRQHHTLATAQRLGLLTYVRPIDLRDPNIMGVLEGEFGDLAHIPPEGPHQFLVHVDGQPVLLAGEHVLTFTCDQWAIIQGVQRGVWTYRFPADLRQTTDRAALCEAAGFPDFETFTTAMGGELTTATDGGLFHFMSLHLPDGRQRPALIPLGDAWSAARMAIAYGGDPGRDTNPEGMLLPL
jgi:hypothetical protein